MSPQHRPLSRRQKQRARREIARAIDSATSRTLRDELIVLAQRAELY
jgi:hypothetical protein